MHLCTTNSVNQASGGDPVDPSSPAVMPRDRRCSTLIRNVTGHPTILFAKFELVAA
jgi:hypothetical protein